MQRDQNMDTTNRGTIIMEFIIIPVIAVLLIIYLFGDSFGILGSVQPFNLAIGIAGIIYAAISVLVS